MSTTALATSTMNIAIQINTLQELQAYCAIIAKTDMIPKGYQGKPDSILVAVMHGQELGLKPLQALQSIAVINGIPSIYGDAGLSLVRSSGLLAEFDEWLEIEGQRVNEVPNLIEAADKGHRIVQWCRSRRKDSTIPRITTYSVTDAKLAKLWLKKKKYADGNVVESPWCTNPGRMLMFRCRGFNLRDEFGDVLKGTRLYEEAMDFDIDMELDQQGAYKAPDAAPTKPSSLAETLKANAPKPVVPPTPTEPSAETTPPTETSAPSQEPPPTDSATPPQELSIVPQIQEEIATLIKTPKGTALLNGIRKMFKVKNDDLWPNDPGHHKLYLNALKEAVGKL